MPSPTPTDYLQQLHQAIQETRETLFSDGATADAIGASALEALDVSRRTYLNADAALRDSTAALRVAAYLDHQLVDANLTAINGFKLATQSHAKGIAATAAMATAAATIKTAADAVEATMAEIFKVAGITQNDEANQEVDRLAQAARNAVELAGRAVEGLRTRAVDANVEAARIKTAPALEAAEAARKSVADILGAADHAFTGAAESLANTLKTRADDLLDLSGKSVEFIVADRDDAAIHAALKAVDEVVNLSLHAAVIHDKTGSGIKVTGELPAEILADTKSVEFFAVPKDIAGAFDFAAASKGKSHPCHAASWRPADTGKFAVTITKHLAKGGGSLVDGVTYVVFALRMPKGDPRPTDLCLPCAPIEWSSLLAFEKEKPAIHALDNGAFVVAFNGGPHPKQIDHYELFFQPQEIYAGNSAAERRLLGELAAANFVKILPGNNAGGEVQDLVNQIKAESQAGRPASEKKLSASGLESLASFLRSRYPRRAKPGKKPGAAKSTRELYVVYFSPFATREGLRTGKPLYRYVVGEYIDMYGDLLKAGRPYYALVRAVSAIDPKAADRPQTAVVSQPASYPPGVQLPSVLPEDAGARPESK